MWREWDTLVGRMSDMLGEGMNMLVGGVGHSIYRPGQIRVTRIVPYAVVDVGIAFGYEVQILTMNSNM